MEWINCKDELPEENKTVLVYTDWDCDNYDLMSYDGKDWYLDSEHNFDIQYGIIHWAKIEPPKQD